MQRWVYVHTSVDGQPAQLDRLLRERIRDLLLEATGTPPEPSAVDGSFALRLDGSMAGLRTTKHVRARTEVAEVVGNLTRIGLSWRAEPGGPAFPAFEGAVELEPQSSQHARFAIVGAYRVPLGPVGAALDGLTLHTVAERTLQSLVERVSDGLERLTTGGEPPRYSAVPALTMRVRDVMTPEPMVFDEELSLRSAALLLVNRGVQGAPVVSETGALVGVLSEQDMLEKEADPGRPGARGAKDAQRRRDAVTAGEACSRPARVTVPDASLRSAAREMLDEGVARLVVVDGSTITGIVTRHDVLKALLRSDTELQKAVDRVLDAHGEPDMRALVAWGEVTLSGTASLRSQAERVVRGVSQVDGVWAVHGEPGWRVNDLAPFDEAIAVGGL